MILLNLPASQSKEFDCRQRALFGCHDAQLKAGCIGGLAGRWVAQAGVGHNVIDAV